MCTSYVADCKSAARLRRITNPTRRRFEDENIHSDKDKLLDYLSKQLFKNLKGYEKEKFDREVEIFLEAGIYECPTITKEECENFILKSRDLDRKYKLEFINFMNDYINKRPR